MTSSTAHRMPSHRKAVSDKEPYEEKRVYNVRAFWAPSSSSSSYTTAAAPGVECSTVFSVSVHRDNHPRREVSERERFYCTWVPLRATLDHWTIASPGENTVLTRKRHKPRRTPSTKKGTGKHAAKRPEGKPSTQHSEGQTKNSSSLFLVIIISKLCIRRINK